MGIKTSTRGRPGGSVGRRKYHVLDSKLFTSHQLKIQTINTPIWWVSDVFNICVLRFSDSYSDFTSQWWKVTKYIYSSSVLKYSFGISIFCYFILLLHYISQLILYFLLHYIHLTAVVTFHLKISPWTTFDKLIKDQDWPVFPPVLYHCPF